jgi:hypothetical protein
MTALQALAKIRAERQSSTTLILTHCILAAPLTMEDVLYILWANNVLRSFIIRINGPSNDVYCDRVLAGNCAASETPSNTIGDDG